MRPLSLLGIVLFISFALAGQFPEFDGVFGGVPKDSASKSVALVAAEPDAATSPTTIMPGKLRYKENTGVCETTPGVYQASGYADLTSSQSMWFWFFAARNDPDTAPLSIWLNGGPGSSSMIGLFQEMGPCRINQDGTSVSRNPYAWNEYSNMLFIDQPIGVGYSHGETVVGTSKDAAITVWKMLQVFFADPNSAQSYCNSRVLSPLAGNYDVYDVRVRNPDPYPYDPTSLLTSSSFRTKIGALKTWSTTNNDVYSNFAATGDWMRNSRPDLEKVINAGVRTLILAGDADYICNYIGFESMVDALQTKYMGEYRQQKWTNWTVTGTAAGQYKNVGTFSYLRVYQAGHEVPAYGNGKLAIGQAALVYFTQTMQGKPISSA
ncbi:unnamed protein product [Rhizoctonia solani]|uniref:Uncharacterized protein n=1 Tax=Rhizoctonia solani TaxID=456999 RepID=A0A8H3D1H0_9AGAM|nr:unnamed protein product [Rhizoctonia solani]